MKDNFLARLNNIEDTFNKIRKYFWEDDLLPWETKNAWSPKVDIWEDKDKIVVEAELPGVDKKDVDVNINDGLLTIRAVSEKKQESKEKNYYRSERSFGEFVRSIRLPYEIDNKNVKATFKNGVLEVQLPKTKEVKEKNIKVAIE
ncbi:MAG: Hsp20/alpha crystallin family protein [Endomicrobiia bacterium]